MTTPGGRRRRPRVDAVRAVAAVHMDSDRALAARADLLADLVLADDPPPPEELARYLRQLAQELRKDPIRRGRPT